MIEGWKEYRLGELVKLQQGFAVNKKSNHHISIERTAFPLLKISDLINGTETLFVKDSIPKQFCVDKNEIIYSRTGQVGLAFMGRKGIVYNNCFRVTGNSDVNTKFLYLWLNTSYVSDIAKSLATGAAQPDLNHGAFKSIKIHLPPLPTQRKIATILSAYNALIENNLKRIKLLEEMAQNEFNNWYANNEAFEEVNLGSIIGHEIGGGWGAEEQSEEFKKPVYVIRGTDIDELPNGKLEKVPCRFHKKSNLASRKLQDGDIIFEVSGGSSYEGVAKTLLVIDELLNQFDNAVMPASFCKLARPIERKYSSFLFLFWRFLRNIRGTEVFEIRSASNIVNYNWTAFLKFQKIKKPSETELEKFNKKVEPIFKQVYKLGNQNQYLKEARDILLPRLMTGMIDVEKLELEL